jgi:hypothetical protein
VEHIFVCNRKLFLPVQQTTFLVFNPNSSCFSKDDRGFYSIITNFLANKHLDFLFPLLPVQIVLFSQHKEKRTEKSRIEPPLVFHFSGRCSHLTVQTSAPPTRFCFNTIQWQMVSSKSRFRSNREFVVHQIPRLGFAF